MRAFKLIYLGGAALITYIGAILYLSTALFGIATVHIIAFLITFYTAPIIVKEPKEILQDQYKHSTIEIFTALKDAIETYYNVLNKAARYHDKDVALKIQYCFKLLLDTVFKVYIKDSELYFLKLLFLLKQHKKLTTHITKLLLDVAVDLAHITEPTMQRLPIRIFKEKAQENLKLINLDRFWNIELQ
jgi:hypothetical protein